MRPSNCSISISGLELSDQDTIDIEKLLQIHERSTPMGTIIKLRILNGESEINGFLEVISSSFHFESSCCGIDALEVVREVIILSQKKISLWINQRTF